MKGGQQGRKLSCLGVLSDKIPAQRKFHLILNLLVSQYIAAVRSSVEPSDHGTGDSEILQGV